jgi:hypothetical protein
VRVKILNLDGVPDSAGDTIVGAGLEIPGPVPIQWKFSDRPQDLMGMAFLERREDGIWARLCLNGEWSENSVWPLTPSIGGVCLERLEGTITSARISSVGLDYGPNMDRRIKSIGEQLGAEP